MFSGDDKCLSDVKLDVEVNETVGEEKRSSIQSLNPGMKDIDVESNQSSKGHSLEDPRCNDRRALPFQTDIVGDGHEKYHSPKEENGSGKKGKKNQGRRSGDKKSQKPQPQSLDNDSGGGENQPPRARKQKRIPSSETVEQVTRDLSHLEVQSFEVTRGAYLKRNKETLTIEGSPLVKTKRRDMRPTPVAYRGGGRTELQQQQEQQKQRHGAEQQQTLPPPPPQQGRVVQILSFQSQDHDTKDHQENVRRTLLLSGPKGCLRRPEVSSFLQWIDDSRVPPIQLTDLLRVHEYSYLNHLMQKCQQLENSPQTTAPGPFPSFYAPPGYLDTDTPLTKSSFDTAKAYCRSPPPPCRLP